jgi:hypothetical protein
VLFGNDAIVLNYCFGFAIVSYSIAQTKKQGNKLKNLFKMGTDVSFHFGLVYNIEMGFVFA